MSEAGKSVLYSILGCDALEPEHEKKSKSEGAE
jgi:hypothetical protein